MKRKTIKWQYPGGKNQAGTYQTIINQMPPHKVYIELFLGSGAIMRRKKPAFRSYGIDANAEVCRQFEQIKIEMPQNIQIYCNCALTWLDWFVFKDRDFNNRNVLIYADPPYLMETRSTKKRIYKKEFATPEDHRELLTRLKKLECNVIISGYYSDLYAEMLDGWRTVEYENTLRNGKKGKEILWLNFPEPDDLHDFSYFGKNADERWNSEKRRRTVFGKLDRMSVLQRKEFFDFVEQWKQQNEQ